MKKNKFTWIITALLFLLLFSPSLKAVYFSSAEEIYAPYRLSGFTIPTTPGGVTDWAENGLMPYTVVSDGVEGTFLRFSIGGYFLSDGVTGITSNNGIGVQFKISDINGCFPEMLRPPFEMAMPASTSCLSSSIRVSYRLVRLGNYVPSGEITMPNVQVLFDNNAQSPVGNFGHIYYSGYTDQPIITSCTIDVPAVIKLDDLPSAEIRTGSMNIKSVPLTFTNCPGAINNIRYQFTSIYGPHDTVYGTINTKPGSAAGIYFQLLRAAGDPYQVSTFYDLAGYNGSGNYTIPFSVAYFTDTPQKVTVGDVDGQITLVVSYQ